MIILYQFAPALGLPNASPFCMKAETYLRMAGLPYETRVQALPMKAPKGKLPYIDDEGTVVADSGFIIEYLKGKYGDSLDRDLTPLQRAQGHAIRRMIEENLYWAVLYFRWIVPEGWAVTREAFFGGLPGPAKWIASTMARRGLAAELRGHGMGRHGREEIFRIGNADITALAELLGDKSYFLGEQPSFLDATAYAFLANILSVPLDSPFKRHAEGHANLRAYADRMKARYYA